MIEYSFTSIIKEILRDNFGEISRDIFEKSKLIEYINYKTKSANKGSKSRGSFASLYAIYTLVEDYLDNGYDIKEGYDKYKGAKFTDLLDRQRSLLFGEKLQNHALNHRMNQEFKKIFPTCEYIPILRNLKTNRYWINENLLKINIQNTFYNIGKSIIQIIDEYIITKKKAFESFLATCEKLISLFDKNPDDAKVFILNLLAPNIDARIFEIVSFAILKYYYHEQSIYFGFNIDNLEKENLKLYKTGRTNANDGGIDFVMKPLGRFFQVTETTNVKKYFLDIDKIERYPITFVIKSNKDKDKLLKIIKEKAKEQYSIEAIVENYINCIEEIISLPNLKTKLNDAINFGYLNEILNEIVIWSKIEFNYPEK